MAEEGEEEIKAEEKPKEEIKKKEPSIDNIISGLGNFRIGQLLQKKKKRPRKERKQLKDPIENALDIIRYEKYTKADAIKNVLQNNIPGYDKEDNVDFVQLLMATRFFNTNLNINDILGGRCFYAYIGDIGFADKKYIFTNDRLYWIANLYEILKKDEYKGMSEIVEMDSKTINIQAINKENVDYRKGYINDHFSDFSIIGYEAFSDEERNALVNSGTIPTANVSKTGTFPIKDIEYKYTIYTNGACIVYDGNKVVKDFMQSYEIIGQKKNISNDIGIKLYQIGDNKNIYISQDVKLSDYWPCEVIFNSPLNYSCLYKFSINMVKYESQIIEANKETAKNGELNFKNFLIYNNIIDFNNFNLMLNFVTAEILGNFKGNQYSKFNSAFTNFMDEWKKVKNDFITIRKVMNFFLRLFDTFFCSFRDRISYKAFSRFSNIITKHLNLFENSLKDNREGSNIYKNFGIFLTKYYLHEPACVIFNACSKVDTILQLAKDIKGLADKVKNLSSDRTIFQDMKHIGQRILNFYYNNNDNTHLINEIRTPSLFLGDLLSGGESKVATEILKTYKDEAKENIESAKIQGNLIILLNKATGAVANRAAIIKYFEGKGLKNVGIIQKSKFSAELDEPYSIWYKNNMGSKKLPEAVTAYGKAIFVDDKYAESVISYAKDELEKIYQAYLASENADKAKKDYEVAVEKKEEKEKKIPSKKEMKKGKDEESESGTSSTIDSIPIKDLSDPEYKNYEKLAKKIKYDDILKMYIKDKGIFGKDEEIKKLLGEEKEEEEEK